MNRLSQIAVVFSVAVGGTVCVSQASTDAGPRGGRIVIANFGNDPNAISVVVTTGARTLVAVAKRIRKQRSS